MGVVDICSNLHANKAAKDQKTNITSTNRKQPSVIGIGKNQRMTDSIISRANWSAAIAVKKKCIYAHSFSLASMSRSSSAACFS